MSAWQEFIKGVIGTVIGIIGNLLAAFIQNSLLGSITTFQFVIMVASILVVFGADAVIRKIKYKRQNKIIAKTKSLQVKLDHHRRRVQKLHHQYNSGIIWTHENVGEWLENQDKIAELKRELRANGIAVGDHAHDTMAPPPVSKWVRCVYWLKHVTNTLAIIMAIGLSYLMAPITQNFIIASAHAYAFESFLPIPTPTPTFSVTPTLSVTPTASVTPTPSVTPTVSVTPTPSVTPTASVTPTPSVTPPPTNTPTRDLVLWDLSHYQENGRAAEEDIALYWHENYSSLKVELTDRGLENDTSGVSLDQLNLNSYNLIIVNLAWSWEQSYSAEEAEMLRLYVQQGGNLMLIGDHAETPNESIAAIGEQFGVTFGASPYVGTNRDGLEFLTILSEHPIFEGVDRLVIDYWDGAIRMANDVNLVATARHENGELVVAALEVGEGKVLAMGSMGMWTDSEIASFQNDEQNLLFAFNVFDWMLNDTRRD